MAGSGTTSTCAAAEFGLTNPAMATVAVAIATEHVDHVRNLMKGGFIEVSRLLRPLWAMPKTR